MWGPDALRFFEELEADNSREFFQANRERYDREVRIPMEDLLDAARGEFGEGKVFRPNRDVRFSKDKSPYKLNCAAVVGGGTYHGCYVSLSKDGLVAGGGIAHGSPDQIERFREAVDDEARGEALGRALDGVRAAGLEVEGERLKRAPRGWDPDHPRIELLRHKTLICTRTWSPAPAWLADEDAVREHVFGTWRAVRPVLDWWAAEVGPARRPVRS